MRRVPVSKPRKPRSRRQQQHQRQLQQEQEHADALALAEVKSLAETLDVTLAEAVELLADDREGYVPPAALAPATEEVAEEAPVGSLLVRGTVDAYIAAIMEL